MNPENPTTPSPEDIPLATSETIPAPPSDETAHHRYGGFMTRYFATVIDGIIIFFVVGAVALLLSLISEKGKGTTYSPGTFIVQFLQFLLYFVSPVYTIYFLYKKGATPGKRLLHLKVISANHEPLTIGRLFIREVVGKMLSGLFGSLGYFWYLFDENRQAWHDKLAHTLVIDTREISEQEYEKWHEKQKSSLPLFILLSSLTPFLFLCILYLLSQLSQFQQYVVAVYPLTETIMTVLMIMLGINVFIYIVIGLWLYRKQKASPFLQGTPTKIGIASYIFFQIMTAVLIAVVLILSTFFILAQFRTSQHTTTVPKLDYNTVLYANTAPTLTPTPPSDFLQTMRSLQPIVPDKDWQPMIRDSLRLNPYKTPLYGYSRTYILPQTANKDTLSLLQKYSVTLRTMLPLGVQNNDNLTASGVDGSQVGFTQTIGSQARIITFTYHAEWADFSPDKGPICPCSGRFDVFYSDPFSTRLLSSPTLKTQ